MDDPTTRRHRKSAAGATFHTAKPWPFNSFNRILAPINLLAILALFYHHITHLYLSLSSPTTATSSPPFFTTLAMLVADFVLGFMWLTTQAMRMNPIRRREMVEKFEKVVADGSGELPGLDVFICTADPYKEPPIRAVNTALSVMAYEYPRDKLSVYVSDDGGSDITLFSLMEVAKFASRWLPFCDKNNVVDRNPAVYFELGHHSSNVSVEEEYIKGLYESMKLKLEDVLERGKVDDQYINGVKERELRVSATMTNAPIVLTLDCDMYSNDPRTPIRAMCYFCDPNLGPENSAYLQFPQSYHGINKNDIYAGEFQRLFRIQAMGLDGLRGPNNVGTGCFFRRRVFFGGPSTPLTPEIPELGPDHVLVSNSIQSKSVLELANKVAGCTYENKTSWGYKMGYRYGSLVEDMFIGYSLHCEGWRSIFCCPERSAFLGDAPISLVDMLTQQKRWAIGVLEVGFSKYSALTYGVKNAGLLTGLGYCQSAFWPIWAIPLTIYAFLPQLALLNNIHIFPKATEAWFWVYTFLFLAAHVQDLADFLYVGGTVGKWWSDQRIWLLRGLTCHLFGMTEYFLKFLGISADFNLTSKLIDEEQSKRYDQGIFEFGVHNPMFVPPTMAAMVNLLAFLWGVIGVIRGGIAEGPLIEVFVAGFAMVNCWPIYEAVALRSDDGRMPVKTIVWSVVLASIIYVLAHQLF
ncbi:Cellulose synthase-like protein G2 [Linum perenne]